MSESVPLIKVLTESGAGSRRAMTAAIKAGRVSVDGVIVSAFNHPVDVARDAVTLDWQPVKTAAPSYTYLLMHKPVGVLTTTRDERGRATVMALLPAKYRGVRLFPVGRLDKDSSGLLLLTNDGSLTYRLTHPRYEHEKEYLVRLDAALSAKEVRRFRAGLDLEDGVTRAAVCEPFRGAPEFRYRVVIHEGRKRQLRRMFATLGRRVEELQRVRLGPLRLENLAAGRCRDLTLQEIRDLSTA